MSSLQKIDESSPSAGHSALDIFSVRPSNVAINKSGYVEIIPQNTITQEGPYEFQSYADNRWYDLSKVYVRLTLSIVKKDGSEYKPIEATDKDIGVIQNPGQSFFETVKVFAQNVEISSQSHYPYLCYLKNMLSFTEEARSTLLVASGYYTDKKHDDSSDEGLKARVELFKNGNVAEFVAKLEFDLSNQDRFFLNNVNLMFQLHRVDDRFLLHATNVNDETLYRVKLHDMRLWIKMVDVIPSVNVGVLSALEKTSAKYALRKTDVRTLFLSEGRTEIAHNIYSSIRPRRLTVVMVDNEAYSGTIKKTPFNFKIFDLRTISVECGANTYPLTRYDLSFTKTDPSYMRLFVDMHDALNVSRGNAETCGITLKKFLNGWFTIVIPTNPLLDDGEGFELIEQGTTTLKLKFSKPIPAGGVSVIVLAEFDQLLSIDQNRVIIADGSPS